MDLIFLGVLRFFQERDIDRSRYDFMSVLRFLYWISGSRFDGGTIRISLEGCVQVRVDCLLELIAAVNDYESFITALFETLILDFHEGHESVSVADIISDFRSPMRKRSRYD